MAGKTFDERILLFYYYWSDYMLDVGLDFCCNYYNTKNTSIDTRRWHQRQPAYVWGYPDSCLQEAAEQGLLEPGYPPDNYGEVVVTIMKGGVRYARAPGRDHGAVSQEYPDGPAGDDRRIRRDHTVKQTEKQ